MHHIVSDAWSLGLLIRETAAVYQGETLPPLPVQYPDFAVWQRRHLSGAALDKQLDSWRRRLAGLPAALELPTDHPRPPRRTTAGGQVPVRLSAVLSAALNERARQAGVTPFILLLAALQALLHRWSGQDDLAVGTVVANRGRSEVAGLIGFFVNTLVLRGDLSGDPAFGELLGRLRAVTLEAFSHQDLPFEKLVEEIRPERDPSRTPLFQVMLSLQNTPLPELRMGDIRIDPLPSPAASAKFDLSLALRELPGDDAFSGALTYSADLFEAPTALRLLDHLARLLESALARPESRLSELALLSPAERHQLVREWNDSGAGRAEPSALARFEAQAARTPDAPAAVDARESLTFRELDRRAAALAAALRSLGVGPESRVGLFLDRGTGVPAAMLGVWKVGGAWVPLDPSHPDERLAFTAQDAGLAALVTETALRERRPDLGVPVAEVDRLPEGSFRGPDPLPDPLPNQAAYVLYTSGSTGRPKGAVVEHGALANYLAWIGGLLGGEALPAVTSPTFDPSLKQLFCPLLEGRPARILPEAVAARPAALLAELAAGEYGALNCVPTLWSAMLDLVEAGRAPAPIRLRRLFLGGQALPPDLLERTAAVLPGLRVWNLYGPTEATANATAAPVAPGDPVTLGRPLTGTRAHGLDRHGHLVPANVPGELCLGGAGLARGYLGRPGLTAERFVPDPFSETPGARLYRTGDVVRRRPDGCLEFRGRTDHQVKVRGFRVELGEIEARLAEHPRVREAVVLAQSERRGETRLTACLVPDRPAGLDGLADDLKAWLRERLPEPMVPAAFVWLEGVPRTTTGKPDRRMLAGVAAEAAQSGPVFVAPRTPAEELLAGLWSEVLGKAGQVGAFDDFFALGGHSLLATQLVSRIRESFGMDLPLALLFEASTLAALAARIEAAMRAGVGLAAGPIRPVPHDRPLPLSFAQERLWFLDRLQPGNAAYNLPAALRLHGEVRPALIEAVLREIVRRHASLRTLFAVADGQPVQIVAGGDAALPLVDLAALPAGGREEEIRRVLAEEVSRPFDLERGPLLRALLLREGPAEHTLIFDTHHIVSDGWSMGVLVREVTALYGAALTGRPSPLPDLAVQYPDFAVWQREWLSGEVLERQLGYWRERLAGAPALDLPIDRPRPAVQGFRGDRVAFQVPPAAAEGLQRLARRSGSTLFMVLLAAFAVWLRRATGQDDLPVGTPIANRNRRETEGLIGFFVNTLVLRLDLAADLALTELLGRIRQTALGAYAHQDLPFERLVEALRPERRLSHNPLFQVVLALQNAPAGEIDLPGLTLSPLPFETRTAKFDLGATFVETGGALAGSLEYAADLFDAATVRRFASHLGVLLDALEGGEDRRVSELPLLTPAERAQIQEWSEGGAPGEARDPLDLFEEQVALRPESLALSREAGEGRGGGLTYAELDRQANRLAAILRDQGVGPGSRVGLQVERSLGLAVGLLGIWKAGGAYVPLDPALPEARLAFLLEDAEPTAVVTEDLIEQAAQPGPAILSGPRAEPEDPAYLIYTSGTTGRPKGVLVERRNLAATLAATRALFDFRPGDRTLCVAPFSFDIFLFELLSPLATGGTAVLLPLRPALEMGTLLATLQGAAHFHAVPALMRQVVEAVRRDSHPDRFGRFGALRTLFTGGDAVPAELLADLRETFPGAAVWELYGPTEATILCAAWPAPGSPARSLLGRPLAGARVEVRDPAGRPGSEPSPVGFPGEIRIGGAGVARGYWRRAELTAERFVEEAGERFYRSGDLGRWRVDGQLEFLGRIDRQVKVRGFRIELGEVESVLARHPGVRAAAAAVAGERLVAYVVPAGLSESLAGELRRLAQAELPDYMVPSAFVTLEALPLTAHGKLDRAALPAPEPAPESADTAGLEPPRTPTEEALAAVWSALLGTERIGRESDFFELGGHSLLGIQAVSRLRDRFGVEVPVRALFEAPKLAALAAWIDGRRGELEGAAGLPPVTPVPRDGGDFPLSFAQERMWFLYQLDPGSPVYNMPAALRLTGDLDAGALAAALRGVVRRHEALRTTFPATVGQPRQRVSPDPGSPLAEVDLRALPRGLREAELARVVGEEARRPFDLAAGPVMRAVLFREGTDSAVLLLALHHIVSDGWSVGVLVREVAALYRARTLPELPVQYPDFAVWQRRWLQGAALERELAWWRERLAGEVPVLRLPTDRPRPPVLTTRGGRRRLALGPALAARLEALSRDAGATLFMTLLAGFQALLARLAGQDDVWVGSPVANRNRSELEGLIGFFVNTLVLRGDLSGDPAFGALVGRARQTALGAFAHQDVPFEKLVEELRPERDASRTPLFQVMFALQNAPMPALDLGGLRLEPVEHDSGASRFDLTMSLQEVPGRGILGTVEYNADLFDPTTMDRLAQCYQNLLASAVEGDPRLSELALLGAAERQQLLVEWNDSEKRRGRTAGTGRTETLHGLFLAQAAETPDAPALRTAADNLTYRELAARASRLAHHLIGLGVVPETRVGVCLPRSFDLIAGVLGVLLSGGAYVPLDPSYPRERLQWMLEDSGAAALVTLSGLAADLAAPGGGRIELDRLEGGAATPSPPVTPVDPAGLCYVIYTSGSTGRPKGVLATHCGVANTVLDTVDRLRLGPGERFLQFASLSFDGSVAEIFSTLASGACLCLIEHGTLPVGEHLAAALRGMEVTTALIPPSVLATLEDDDFPHLHTLNVSAETCPAETVRRWAPGRRFLNLYGPTEASVYMTLWEAGPEETAGPPPIGRPIANSQACVVDAAGNPVPLGVPGELLIGGDCLARGYLGRPDLTAELFVPDPHTGQRLYRTGDLCRFRPDGHLEMLGRLDHQVKVRGFRIELGEIEAALARHPAVESAVVTAREDVPGDRRLVAYVVPAGDGVDVQALRDGLAASLPHYMVPGFFVVLPELPITANGKIDRRRLPAPEQRRTEAAAFLPPSTAAEQALVRIWSEVLGLERVGVGDSFFDLGGHSLLLPRIQARIREDLGRDIPLLKLIEHPTVAALAGWLEGAAEALPGPDSRDRVRRQRQALDLQRQRLAGRTRER
jgi:amino acid adenylation domain-containing protein